jgi:ABC-2 type transport system ATP-binding protein
MPRYAAEVSNGAPNAPALDARSLTTSYGRSRGIVDIDLQIEAGEVVGLVGANGAGKTTFMRTMLDFIRPTSGSVRIFGLDSVRDSVDVRRRTSYLPGELVLPRRLTGHDAIDRYTLARRTVDKAAVRKLAERLDLDLSRRVGDLSKGNKQKVGLILAMAPKVDLLVLDEPTSGLDPLLQREFTAMVAERASDGATVLLSSHVMSEVEQVASRVALLRAGRLATVDEMAAIRAQARRRGVVQLEAESEPHELADELRQLSGVGDVAIDGTAVSFACSGEMDAVVKTVARFHVISLDVAHADLEDAFFSAYDGPTSEGGGGD